MIIIEGHDASGKSTLAQAIAQRLSLTVKESEGPPKYPGEMHERIERYDRLAALGYIFVRHPVVSQPIYGVLRSSHSTDQLPFPVINRFYKRKLLLIYCDPKKRGLSTHVLKPHDTPDHEQAVKDNYCKILTSYRNWALERAHIIYRIGDDVERVIAFCLTHIEPSQ